MGIEVLDTVVLRRDLPTHGLRVGDVGAVVEKYGFNAFEVEFVTGAGRTQALVTLMGEDLRVFGEGDLLSARPLDAG
jgi:hypothetical protein